MILIEQPRAQAGRKGIFGGRPFRAAHAISDIAGPGGHAELVDFARRIGMRRNWLRAVGTMFECVECANEAIEAAYELGARRVTCDGLLAAIYRKKGARNAA
jgi:hypothetical protein